MIKTILRLIAFFLALTNLANAQHEQHQQDKKAQDHHQQVNQRGDHVMGFSHTKTIHHFRLKSNGGVIEVTANEADDIVSRDQIRSHLKHITQKFSQGDFAAPMLIHGQTPPGVGLMKQLKANIKYQFEETKNGAQLRITTTNAKARKAIHEFLRFQIEDHRTGDSLDIEK